MLDVAASIQSMVHLWQKTMSFEVLVVKITIMEAFKIILSKKVEFHIQIGELESPPFQAFY